MKKILIMLFCVSFLLGCAAQRHFKTDIANALQPASLRSSFNTQSTNFKELSKCATPDVSINLVNAEKNNDNINAVPGAVVSLSWKINPHELIDQIIAYMENSYRQCRVINSVSSPKTIQISLKKLEGFPTGAFKFNSNANLQLTVYIPEKKHAETFTSIQSSGDLYMAVVYSIHDITWQIINDPVIQDYILCR
jgi:hypothetical protein